jgi:putative ABC transport system permease protein
VSVLGRKLGRDLLRLKGQVATIALVLACGMMAMIMLRSTWQSLTAARDRYYADYRFADVFARVQRAPEQVAAELERIPGVARVYPRLVEEVMVPLPAQPDPVTGRIVSIPDDGVPPLNGLYLRAGRLPMSGDPDEAVILEQFAAIHHLAPGDRLPVVMNGSLRSLRIVGLAMSPEYVLAMGNGSGMFDSHTFVVVWMLRGSVAPTFRMEGAFNDVALRLEPRASLPTVLDAVDLVLARHGGFHAIGRDRQQSHAMLTGELDNLRNLALVIPAVFLAVAAFLVNVVVSRLVFLERSQIAVLKALGFSDRQIGLHYLGLVALIVALAAALGLALGDWSARWMTALYADFYRFPSSLHHLAPDLVAITVGIGLGAAVIGALGAVRRVARMAPAQAMRPPVPLSYRRTLAERLGLGGLIGPSALMVVREIERRPLRFLLSTAGIAMGVAIFLLGQFSWDSFDRLMNETFPREHREDLTVQFASARPARAVRDLAHLPGVALAEGQRSVPVRFRAGARWRDAVIIGDPYPSALRQILDGGEVPLDLPEEGLVLTDRLAERLEVEVGDEIEVEVLEGSFAVRRARVAGLVDEPFGMFGHARADWLSRWLGEQPQVTAVLLDVDGDRVGDVRARLKELPVVVGVASTERTIEAYRSQTGESMQVMTLILVLSAAAIAVGVVYNNARIALSMRSRDLTSLRVLGFTRREISSILLGEIAIQVGIGIPLGLLVGTAWARYYAGTIDQDVMRFPFHIAPATYAAAASIALVAGVISALLVRRRLDRLDLVAVLKSSE